MSFVSNPPRNGCPVGAIRCQNSPYGSVCVTVPVNQFCPLIVHSFVIGMSPIVFAVMVIFLLMLLKLVVDKLYYS